jgi:hypothetical protein
VSILNFFHPVLKALSDGRVIRTTVVWVLRILAVLLLLDILEACFRGAGAGLAVGGVLLALILLLALACVAQVLFYRAASVEGLTDSTLTVIPIVSILFRAAGEVYATLGVAVGVGGCLFTWLAGASPSGLLGAVGGVLPTAPGDQSFLGGLMFLAYMAVASFLVLVVFYFLAEGTLLWADMAHNMRLLRQHFVQSPQPAVAVQAPPPVVAAAPPPPVYQAPPPPVAPPAPVYQAPPPPRCSSCGAELEAGSAFCGNCGARLR